MSSERRSKITPAEIAYHARRRIATIAAWTKDDTEESCLANARPQKQRQRH
jgi:hypothetical protein